jgi:hypothetical protein
MCEIVCVQGVVCISVRLCVCVNMHECLPRTPRMISLCELNVCPALSTLACAQYRLACSPHVHSTVVPYLTRTVQTVPEVRQDHTEGLGQRDGALSKCGRHRVMHM